SAQFANLSRPIQSGRSATFRVMGAHLSLMEEVMRRLAVVPAAVMFCTAALYAQQATPPTPATARSGIPNLTPSLPGLPQQTPAVRPAKEPPSEVAVPTAAPFDSAGLELKYQSGMWQLWAGSTLIKDFGR